VINDLIPLGTDLVLPLVMLFAAVLVGGLVALLAGVWLMVAARDLWRAGRHRPWRVRIERVLDATMRRVRRD
jgi:hypothetical protein